MQGDRLFHPCPYCAQAAVFAFSTKDLNQRISATRFYYFRCKHCHLIFLAQVPPDLDRYYPSHYYQLPKDRFRLEALARRERFKLDLIRPFQAKGSLLEVGPAWGSFAYAAKGAGYDVSVIEMDEHCCQFLEHVVGVKVYRNESPAKLPQGLSRYDVVTLWHVLEHLPEFKTTLLELADRLKPGGILAVATPNPAAWQFSVMRNHWPHIDAPRHLQLIPASVLCEMLSEAGLSPVMSTSNDPGGQSWNSFGWQRLLMNALPRKAIYSAVSLAAGLAFSKLVAPIEERASRGAAYTVIYRKSLD